MTAQLEERVTRRNGRALRYLTGGDGPPLVLCHGFLGSAENFETWFADLLPRRTLVIPDLPGFGASDPLPVEHSVSALAGTVLTLVDELCLPRVDLGGLCLGASVAMAVVRRRPELVDRLILHTPLLAPRMVRRRFHVQAGVLTAPGLFPAVLWLAHRRTVSDLYKRWFVEGEDVDAAAAAANFANQLRADGRATREWLHDALRRDDVDLLRARGDAPTLLVVAADDRVADVAALRMVASAHPAVRLAVIDDAGHGWTADYVRRQLEVITAFLDGRELPSQPRAAA